jgi:hypothetical protein
MALNASLHLLTVGLTVLSAGWAEEIGTTGGEPTIWVNEHHSLSRIKTILGIVIVIHPLLTIITVRSQ